MASGINKAILVGNLGKNPELRYTPSGQPVASFSLATTENFKDKNGAKQSRTVWHNIVIWGKLAEVANQYLKKGSQVYLEGRIENRSYDDKDGNRKYISEVVLDFNGKMLMMGGRSGGDSPEATDDGGSQDAGGSYGGAMPPGGGAAPAADDDLPF